VVDTRDIIYFISLTAFFIFLTKNRLKKEQDHNAKSIVSKLASAAPMFVIALVALIAINVIASFTHKRYDLTQDQRYSLSDPTKDILDQLNSPMIIDVFLEGSFPAEFKKLQNETRYLLEEMQAYNSNLIFEFSNPVEEGSNALINH